MPSAARALLVVLLVAPLASRPAQGATARPPCTGRYADTLSVMAAAARERESRPSADWVYCLRASAIYEHVTYRRGGKLVHEYHSKTRHGTGFAYRQRSGEWLVATNQHVVAFPEVTGDGQDLEGIPAGSRRVRTEVRIVANEADPSRPTRSCSGRPSRTSSSISRSTPRASRSTSCRTASDGPPTSASATPSWCAATRSAPSRPRTRAASSGSASATSSAGGITRTSRWTPS